MTNTSETNITTESDPESNSESESTTSVSRRWIYTNDFLAGLLLGSLPILTALGSTQVLALTSIPNSWRVAYLVIVGTAAVWTFGSEALEAWRSNSSAK
jgi:hypothetical protein